MLTIKKCRKVLGVTGEASDEEIQELRDRLYDLADTVIAWHESPAQDPEQGEEA